MADEKRRWMNNERRKEARSNFRLRLAIFVSPIIVWLQLHWHQGRIYFDNDGKMMGEP